MALFDPPDYQTIGKPPGMPQVKKQPASPGMSVSGGPSPSPSPSPAPSVPAHVPVPTAPPPSIPGGSTPPSPSAPAPGGDPFQDYWKTIQGNPDRFDPAHFSEAQARAWQPLWTGSGFLPSKKDQFGNPLTLEAYGGKALDHPDECPPGTQAYGKDACYPNDSAQVMGVRPGGGAPGAPGGVPGGPGGGYPGGPGGGPTMPSGGFMSMFGDPALMKSFQGLDDTASFWRSILAPQTAHDKAENFAMTSQQTGGINDAIDAQRQNILASMPPGGQRDAALADLETQRSSVTSGIRSGLTSQALQALPGIYSAEGGLGSGVRGQDLQYLLGKGGQDLQKYGIDVQKLLGEGQLGLGYAGLGEKGREFDLGQDWTQSAWGKEFLEKQRQFDIGQQDWLKQFQRGGQSGFFDLAGSLLGAAGDAGGFGSLFSDERMKKDMKKEKGGLAELKKINPISFRYKEDSSKEPAKKGFSAQNVERSIPSAVQRQPGPAGDDTASIHPMTILAATVNAIRELDERTKGARNLASPRKKSSLSAKLRIPKAIKAHTQIVDKGTSKGGS